jgi:DNA (cytosine-5)-methyltransferase 1
MFYNGDRYTVLDLFCGAGGFSEGFKKAGYQIILGIDHCKQAKENFEYNIGSPGIADDIQNISIDNIEDRADINKDNIDIVIGGPPCQGFSLLGKRHINDPRNFLYKEYIRIISDINPKIFVMENVPALASFDKGNLKHEIEKEFNRLGYYTTCKKLNAANYGVPQSRERLFFVGTKKGYLNFPPEITHGQEQSTLLEEKLKRCITSQEAINDLLLHDNIGSEESFYLRPAESQYQFNRRNGGKIVYNHLASKHNETVKTRFHHLIEGGSSKDLPDKMKTNKRIVKRLKRDYVSPTLTTLPDDLIHYSEDRILTVREMARLQSFDDTYQFIGKRTTGAELRKTDCPQYTLVGNAVPPLLAYAIANELKKSSILIK